VVAYQHLELKAKETILKQNLNDMRKILDQYTADREELPQSLEDLVSAGYLREIPVDPITGEADWAVETGEDPLAREGREGIIDVRSKAAGTGSDGTPYSEY
jgi:general secretion pathway protein G